MPTTPKPSNPPAFPQDRQFDDAYAQLRGMTLRDYFAAAALKPIMNSPRDHETILEDVELAFQYADAMLKAREG